MLTYDPDSRISARKALKLAFFKPLRDLETHRYRPHVLLGQLSNKPDNHNSSKNLDDSTGTEQNNLSDYNNSQRGHKDISKLV